MAETSGPPKGGTTNEDLAACQEVERRAKQTLYWATDVFHFGLLDIALDHLTLGRVQLLGVALDLAEAAALITACGYHRRDQELADAQEALRG